MEQIKNQLDRTIEIFSQEGYSDFASKLRRIEERQDDKSFRILILGEYNRGKSTFLNTFFDKEIFRTSMLRQNTVNIIKYGKQAKASFFKSNDTPQKVDVDKVFELDQARKVELQWNHPFLKKKVEMVEYPTFSESEDRDDLNRIIEEADFIIVMLATDSLYSIVEAKAYKEFLIPSGHINPLFICNFIDRIAEKDLEEVKTAAYVKLPVNRENIIFISTQDVLDGKIKSIEQMDFIKKRLEHIVQRSDQVKLERLKKATVWALDTVLEELEMKKEGVLQQGTSSDEQIIKIRAKLRKLQDLTRRFRTDLLSFKDDTIDVVQGKLSVFLKELLLKIDEWGKEFKGDRIDDYLNKCLKESVYQFSSEDVGKYVSLRLEEQREMLDTGIKKYQYQLEKLYNDLGKPLPNRGVKLNESFTDTSLKTFNLSNDESQEKKRFNIRSLVDIPEAMVTLVGTLVGSYFYIQFAPILIPMGIGTSAYLAYRKFLQQDVEIDLSPYKAQLIEQGRKLERDTLNKLNEELDELQDDIGNQITAITQKAQQEVFDRIQNMQPKNDKSQIIYVELEQIKTSLEVL